MEFILFAVILVLSIALIFLMHRVSKKRIAESRAPLDFMDMYSQANLTADYEIFSKVMDLIGQAFHVNPKLLRPADELKKLYDMDGWILDKGTEQLNMYLEKEFKITTFAEQPKTIAELIEAVRNTTTVPPASE